MIGSERTTLLQAWLANDEYAKHPPGVSPVLATFVWRWYGDLNSKSRKKLLVDEILPLIAGTGDLALDDRRAEKCLDWVVNTHLPAWLSLTQTLTEYKDIAAKCDWRTSAGKFSLYEIQRAAWKTARTIVGEEERWSAGKATHNRAIWSARAAARDKTSRWVAARAGLDAAVVASRQSERVHNSCLSMLEGVATAVRATIATGALEAIGMETLTTRDAATVALGKACRVLEPTAHCLQRSAFSLLKEMASK